MLGVKDHGDIEGAGFEFVRFVAGEHVEEVGGMAEIAARRHGLLVMAQPVVGSHDRRHARGEAGGGKAELFGGKDARFRIERADCFDADFEGPHGTDEADDFAEHAAVEVGELALGVEELVQFRQLASIGEAEVPEEESNLFEGGVVGEFEDVVAGVDEFALLPVDAAELGGGYVHALESPRDIGHSCSFGCTS